MEPPQTKKIVPCRDKWPGRMTERERFNRQMHYQPVDRCFNMEFGYWEENFKLWSIFRENGIANNAEADHFFNFDRNEFVGGSFMFPPFEEKTIRRTETSLIIQNFDGLIAEVPKDRHDTIPHFIKSPIENPDDWRRVKEERFRRSSPERKPDLAQLKKLHPVNRDYPLGIYCGSMIGKVRDLLTVEGLAYAMYDYPEMVEDMVETCCVLVEDYLDQVLGVMDFDYAMGWEDICFKNGPLVSVGFFRDVVVPRYQRISRRLRNHGIDVWYTDCDGDVRTILPLLLEGGINCLFPFEVNCCCHPRDLLDQYHGKLRIMGGVDKMVLANGRPAIRRYMEDLVPLVQRSGYIPFCDHRCPPNVPEQDYLYYLDVKEELLGKITNQYIV